MRSTIALSQWNGSDLPRLEDRRSVLAQISTMVSTPLLLKPTKANALESGNQLRPEFDTYSIIPDAGPKLNPRLKKIDVRIRS